MGGDHLRRRALREGDTWSELKHPNVLPFLGVLETATDFYLVSPYAENGSLSDYIHLHPDVDRKALLSEAAGAIAFLHEHGIVLGDIKASNILVSDDVHALLCDFGLAKSDTVVTTVSLQGIGTVRYQSPELLTEGGGKTFASDVWAFGMTIYEVLSDSIPFHQYTTSVAIITAVAIKDERPPTLPGRSTLGLSYNRLWEVAKTCWQKDPAQRLSMEHAHRRLCFNMVLKGHTGSVMCLAFSPDGTTIASGSKDCTIRLWDAQSRTERGKPMTGHTNAVWCLALSPDGKTIASGSKDNTIRIWDVQTMSQRGSPLIGYTDSVWCLAFSPDGTTIASGSKDRSIRMWDVESRSQKGGPLVGHTGFVWCLAFSPDGTYIVSGSEDCTIRFWDINF